MRNGGLTRAQALVPAGTQYLLPLFLGSSPTQQGSQEVYLYRLSLQSPRGGSKVSKVTGQLYELPVAAITNYHTGSM